jgi:hypothetical protein
MLFHPAAELAASIARASVPVDCVIRCLWRGQPGSEGEGMGTTTFGLAASGCRRSTIRQPEKTRRDREGPPDGRAADLACSGI